MQKFSCMFWEIFYVGTLWVIFGELLDSVYTLEGDMGGEVPGNLCPTGLLSFMETLQRRIT